MKEAACSDESSGRVNVAHASCKRPVRLVKPEGDPVRRRPSGTREEMVRTMAFPEPKPKASSFHRRTSAQNAR